MTAGNYSRQWVHWSVLAQNEGEEVQERPLQNSVLFSGNFHSALNFCMYLFSSPKMRHKMRKTTLPWHSRTASSVLVCQWVESDRILGKRQMYGFIACRENCFLASYANKQVSHFLKFACALSESRVFLLLLNKK